jgi:hypothetical protein
MARKMDFEKLIAKGEAKAKASRFGGAGDPPYGFRAQTVNGTAHCDGPGWNQDYQYGEMPAEATGVWGPGSNRTGE